jgi:hypothetical protein
VKIPFNPQSQEFSMPEWLPKIRQWFKRVFPAVGRKPGPAETDLAPEAVEQDQAGLVPYDENLLERSRTQWQFGDWQTLARLERDTLQHHPDRAKLALLAAAGHAQMGDTEKARQFTRLARDWGCGNKLISQVLIAGVYNTLGKASAIAGQEERALAHFEDGVRLANSGGDVRLLTQARVQHQIQAFDIKWKGQPFNKISSRYQPPTTLEFRINTSSLSGSQCPSDVYECLALLHENLKPKLYLEIGVLEGKSLALAQCESVGVDPIPRQLDHLPDTTHVVTATSDEFFVDMADEWVQCSPDFVFMDGMPLLDYALRDFINIEQRSHAATLVAVANIYPKYPEQAMRRRTGTDWIGDVWKLPQILVEHRPDLKMIGLDVEHYGLLLITNLDPKNQILKEKLPDILKASEPVAEPPADVMKKKGAMNWDDPDVAAFFRQGTPVV